MVPVRLPRRHRRRTLPGAARTRRGTRLRFGALFSADGRFAALPGSDARGAGSCSDRSHGAPLRAATVSLESSPPPGARTFFALSHSGSIRLRGPRVGRLDLRPAVGTARGHHHDRARLAPGCRSLLDGGRGPCLARPFVRGNGWRAPRRDADRRPRADGRSTTDHVFPLAAATTLRIRGESSSPTPAASGSSRWTPTPACGTVRPAWLSPRWWTRACASPPGREPRRCSCRTDASWRESPASPSSETGRPGATLRVFDREGTMLREMQLDLQPMGLSIGPRSRQGGSSSRPSAAPFSPRTRSSSTSSTGESSSGWAACGP